MVLQHYIIAHVEHDELSKVQEVYEEGRMDPNGTDAQQMTPLHHAARLNRVAMTEWLLSLPNINPDLKDVHHRTPLSLASFLGHVDVVRLLLTNNVDPNTHSSEEKTALWIAAEKGHLGVVEVLKELHMETVKLRWRLKIPDGPREGMTAREISVKNQHHDVAEFLQAWEADCPVPIIDTTEEKHAMILKAFLCVVGLFIMRGLYLILVDFLTAQ